MGITLTVKSVWSHFCDSVIVLTTTSSQRSLRKLGIARVQIWMTYVVDILVYPKVKLIAFILMFLTTIMAKTHGKLC